MKFEKLADSENELHSIPTSAAYLQTYVHVAYVLFIFIIKPAYQ